MPPARVSIVHPRLGFGGSEAPVLWAAEALKRDCEVSLITGGPVDLGRLNEYYGTQLQPNEITSVSVSFPPGLRATSKFAGLRSRFVQKFVRQAEAGFDLMISGYGPGSFEKPGLQYIADFSFMYEWRTDFDPSLKGQKNWWYGDTVIRKLYTRLCDAIYVSDRDAWRQNRTLAISNWCTNILKTRLGIEAVTLYPPVAANFPDVPWEKREHGFVSIGRVVPEKRIDMAIRVLRKVRASGHNVHLHILGSFDDSDYGRQLRSLCAENGEWVHPEGRVFEKQKKEVIAAHRYGIHARENEAFGIAPAEMLKGGCITFVPNSGGQVEIVNHCTLTYGSEADAAQKICAVLSSVALQGDLRRHLAEQARKFSVENFMAGFRQVVMEFLNRPVAQPVNHA